MTFEELRQRMEGKTPEEAAEIERQFYLANNIDPDTDLYPPEEMARRFEFAMRHIASINTKAEKAK